MKEIYLSIHFKNGKEKRGWASDLKIGEYTVFGRWRDGLKMYIMEDKRDIEAIYKDGVQIKMKAKYNEITGLPQSVFDRAEGV